MKYQQTNHRWGVLLTWRNGDTSFVSGEGNLPATYLTRADAREQARCITFCRAKAVKVKVTWEAIE